MMFCFEIFHITKWWFNVDLFFIIEKKWKQIKKELS